MPREKEAFRDNLMRLDELCPGKEMLCTSEVQRALGMSRRGTERLLRGKLIDGKWISKAALARLIS